MKFIIPIKKTAGISAIDEVHQLLQSFAKMYPDVIEGIETDLVNPSQEERTDQSLGDSIKNMRKCAICHF